MNRQLFDRVSKVVTAFALIAIALFPQVSSATERMCLRVFSAKSGIARHPHSMIEAREHATLLPAQQAALRDIGRTLRVGDQLVVQYTFPNLPEAALTDFAFVGAVKTYVNQERDTLRDERKAFDLKVQRFDIVRRVGGFNPLLITKRVLGEVLYRKAEGDVKRIDREIQALNDLEEAVSAQTIEEENLDFIRKFRFTRSQYLGSLAEVADSGRVLSEIRNQKYAPTIRNVGRISLEGMSRAEQLLKLARRKAISRATLAAVVLGIGYLSFEVTNVGLPTETVEEAVVDECGHLPLADQGACQINTFRPN